MPATHSALAEILNALALACPDAAHLIDDALGLVVQLEDQARYQAGTVLEVSDSVRKLVRKRQRDRLVIAELRGRVRVLESMRMCEPSRS